MKKNYLDFYYHHGGIILAIAWICISASRILKFWITYDDVDLAYAEGDGAQRIQLLIIIVLSIPLLIKRRMKILPIIKNNGWFFILFSYCAISLLWTDLPALGIRRIFKTFCYILILLVIFTERKPFDAIVIILKVSSLLILGSSGLLILFFPAYAYKEINGEMLISGVAAHKNQLGQWASTAIILLVWQIINNKKYKYHLLNLLFLIFCTLILINCKSITALLMTIISVSVISIYYLCKPHGWKGYFALLSTGFATISFLFLFLSFVLKGSFVDSLFGLFGKDATFTGRADVWQQVFEIAKEKWILGRGFGTFWLSPKSDWMRYTEGWNIFQAHNGYLDTFLHLGIVGSILTLLYLLNGVKGCLLLYKADNNAGILVSTYLIAMLIGNFFETIFSFQNHEFWFISILVCVKYPDYFIKRQQIRIE